MRVAFWIHTTTTTTDSGDEDDHPLLLVSKYNLKKKLQIARRGTAN